MQKISSLEFHIIDACNFSCNQCSHYSNFTIPANLVSIEEAEELYAAWSTRLLPSQFAVLGGEPTLHKDLIAHLELAAKYWTKSRLLLVTNGSFLKRFPTLPEVLTRHNFTLHISKHSDAPDYMEKWNEITALVESWEPKPRVHLRHLNGAWQQQYKLSEDGKPLPFNSKRREAFNACIQRTCTQIRKEGLFKCAALANFATLSKKFGLANSEEWAKFRNYAPATPESTEPELAEMLGVKPIAACALCPSKTYKIKHSNPLLPKL